MQGRLRERRARNWIHAGPVRGVRTRAARIADIAKSAGGVSDKRAHEAMNAACMRCADRLQSAARVSGWGVDTRISWSEEWSEHDIFSVGGASGLADANAWTAMCVEFDVSPGPGAKMVLRVLPGSRFNIAGGISGVPTILLAHSLIDAQAATLLHGDTETLHALHLRARREYAYAWAGLLIYALVLIGLVYFLLLYMDVAPFAGLMVLARRVKRTTQTVWKVITVVGYL